MKLSTGDKIVVVPWDFSVLSLDALLQAIEMVDDLSKIRVVHVTTPLSALEYGVIWNTLHETTVMSRLTDEFAKQTEGYPELKDVLFTVLFGDPGTRVCEFAKDFRASVIILPSHGRTGIARVFLGSVAERIVRLAHCPVLVLREQSTATTEGEQSDAKSNDSSLPASTAN